ncbi:hypothetical protein [Chromobacterium sp. IIBBL 290-4]|uniref:hypothetical protein n=1 Tax=Chromobacterium sp. IIBBL 290-4 TaxID=2953890 RepID=UPI0020B87ED5|nr:hypothetical protein [Chromobacterium sp. IIBBL 290-4]UTH74476.1 hypothetical protein NKT35_23605 [Chromobacterium sp. IIBBL 290-4]
MNRQLIGMALLCAASGAVSATESAPSESCVAVVVDGVRTLPYECLSRQLTPAGARPREAGAAELARSAKTAERPANQLGLFNRSATAIRMGSNFGNAASPQRPPLPADYSPLVPARR